MKKALCTALICALLEAFVSASPVWASTHMYVAHGTWASDDGELTGVWQASFDVAAGQLGGSMTITNLPGVDEGHISGALDQNTIGFVLSKGDRRTTFTGSTSDRTLSGTFETPEGYLGTWVGKFGPAALNPAPENQ